MIDLDSIYKCRNLLLLFQYEFVCKVYKVQATQTITHTHFDHTESAVIVLSSPFSWPLISMDLNYAGPGYFSIVNNTVLHNLQLDENLDVELWMRNRLCGGPIMLHAIFLRAGTPNPCIVQSSTIIYHIYTVYMIFLKKKKR